MGRFSAGAGTGKVFAPPCALVITDERVAPRSGGLAPRSARDRGFQCMNESRRRDRYFTLRLLPVSHWNRFQDYHEHDQQPALRFAHDVFSCQGCEPIIFGGMTDTLTQNAKTDQTNVRSNGSHLSEAPMTQSQTVSTRRRREKARKQLARVAKRAKKLGKKNVKTGNADTSKAAPA